MAPIAYRVRWHQKAVLFSGRIPNYPKVEMERGLFSEISKSRETTVDYLTAVYRLGESTPDLWLPETGADGQNANVYDNEWDNVITYNYRVGYRSLTQQLAVKHDQIEDGGWGLARIYTGSVQNARSLPELRDVIGARGRVALAVLNAEYDYLQNRPRTPTEQATRGGQLVYQIGLLEMYEGRFSEAATSMQESLKLIRAGRLSSPTSTELTALLGVIALHRELEDQQSVAGGHASDGFLLRAEPAGTPHTETRKAVNQLAAACAESPGEMRLRWLLNVAYMMVGEYPDGVPRESLIRLGLHGSQSEIGRFENVAPRVGSNSRGLSSGGGSVFDDFTGDGLPDLFSTSLDPTKGASLYVNRGDGTFEDRSSFGRPCRPDLCRNASPADFDNDGDLDVLLLRGGSDIAMPLSLLMNQGTGTFVDVTAAAGLIESISSGSAAWGDYDNDGLLDLFVCGEFLSTSGDVGALLLDPRNRCRLYRNQGKGRFLDVAGAAGVSNERCAKAAAWGDYDGDGRLDLFVSNVDGPCRLYHNLGNGSFHDVANELGVSGPSHNHSSICWFWDFNNDGRLDLFVNDDKLTFTDMVASYAGLKSEETTHPRLYRNLGQSGFRDVSLNVGFDQPMPAARCEHRRHR